MTLFFTHQLSKAYPDTITMLGIFETVGTTCSIEKSSQVPISK